MVCADCARREIVIIVRLKKRYTRFDIRIIYGGRYDIKLGIK
jgi:hypothetical protein